MLTNAQSIPENSPLTSPEIEGPERQGTLPVGPTGLVHKGGGTVPWSKRCALTRTESKSSKLLFMILATFVNGPDEAAWPSQDPTLEAMTGLTSRGILNATKQLEAAGLVRVERKGGRSIRYWLRASPDWTIQNHKTPEVSSGTNRKSVPVEPEVSSGEGTREVTSTSTREAAALLPVPVQEGVDEKPKAERNRSIDLSTKPTRRHTCSCGNSWPVSCGPKCFHCNGKPKGSAHHAGMASPEPGKYDFLFNDEEPVGLQEAYAARLRAARADAGAERAISKANPPIPPADRSPGRKGNTVAQDDGILNTTVRDMRAVHSKSWGPKRPRYERGDGAFTELPGGC